MSCHQYRPNVPHHSLRSSTQGVSKNSTPDILSTSHFQKRQKSSRCVPDIRPRKPRRYWKPISSQHQSSQLPKEGKQAPSRIMENRRQLFQLPDPVSNVSTQDILKDGEFVIQSMSSSQISSPPMSSHYQIFKHFQQTDFPQTDMELSLTNYMLSLPTFTTQSSRTSLFDHPPEYQFEFQRYTEFPPELSAMTSEESISDEMIPVSSCSISTSSQSDPTSEMTSLFTDLDIQPSSQSSCQEVSTSSLEQPALILITSPILCFLLDMMFITWRRIVLIFVLLLYRLCILILIGICILKIFHYLRLSFLGLVVVGLFFQRG